MFAVTGAVEGIRAVAGAAAEHQAAFARLEQVTKNVGAATSLYGQTLEHLLEKEARVKGFNDEDLAQSFLRILAATHDSAKAYRDLGLAQDISAATGKDLTISALALAKAEQGSVTSLTRLGIIVPKVGTAVQALTHQHDELTAAGVKFSKQQELQYKAQLTAAQATDDLSRKTLALQLVSERYGGVAEHLAKTTASGEFRTFRVEVHQLEVAIGSALLPTLAKGAHELGAWFDRARESGSAAREAHQFIDGFSDSFHALSTALHIVGPPLGFIVRELLVFANSGVGHDLLAVAIGMKAISLGAGLAAGSAARLGRILPTIAAEEGAIVILGNPFALLTAGALAAGFGVFKLVNEIRRAHREEERFQNASTTDRALALDFFAHRVRALEKDGLDAVQARAKAIQDTFEHTGIRLKSGFVDLQKAADAAEKSKPGVDLKNQLAAERVQLAAINANIKTTQGALTIASTELRLAEQGLADAIRQGNEQIQESIRSAESNLSTIGGTLASTIDTFLQAIGRLGSSATDPNSATFKRLRDQIASGNAAPGAARSAAEIANQLQQAQAVSTQTDAAGRTRIQRQFADLTDEFNKGAITLATFNKRVAALLAANHIDYRRAGQVLGVAFADGFRAQVRGLGEQASAIAATPAARRAGITGLEPSIVRPLETIHQVQEQVAAAQRARDEKQLEVTKDTRRLSHLQEAHQRVLRHEAQTQTGIQRKMEGHLKSIAADSRRRAEQDRLNRIARRAAADHEAVSEQSVTLRRGREAAQIGGP